MRHVLGEGFKMRNGLGDGLGLLSASLNGLGDQDAKCSTRMFRMKHVLVGLPLSILKKLSGQTMPKSLGFRMEQVSIAGSA